MTLPRARFTRPAMRSLVLSPPDGRRWGLESLLRNAGYDVQYREDPRRAGGLFLAEDFDLVVINEPDDGAKYAGVFLKEVRRSEKDLPPILCLTATPNVVVPTLGHDADLVHMVPSPVDGLIMKMLFEDLGIPWGVVPDDRQVLSPPIPDRPWGRVGMKEGTVDAAGNETEAPAPAPEETDGADGADEGGEDAAASNADVEAETTN